MSDTHLGYTRYAKLDPASNRNQREVDAQEAYRRAVDAILERDVDLVIHSGDVFDSIRPATHVIINFLKQTGRIVQQDIPYYGIAGNHETPRLRATTAALEYANMVGAYFAHGFEVEHELVDLGDVRVSLALVPHGAVGDAQVVVTPDRDADVNIMVTHGTVPGLVVHGHELGQVDLPERVLGGDFDYVALGHYHYFHEHKKNTYYAGATERFGFGEVDSEPGFAILTFDGAGGVDIEHVPIEARPMIDIPRIDAEGMTGGDLNEAIVDRTTRVDIDGAMVRLKVANAPVGLAGELDRPLLRELRQRALDFSLEISESGTADAPGSNGEVEASFGSLEEEFRAFVGGHSEKGELDAAFAGEFLEKGLGYLRGAGASTGDGSV
ncbi:MAG: metallophosphoesterase [Actinomycetota bacterium]|nr:metallophosphoesterase [Actinomycetota bacterium]